MAQPHDYIKAAFDLIDDLDRLTEVDRVMNRVSSTLANFGYTSFLITGVGLRAGPSTTPDQTITPTIQWQRGVAAQ
jgi:hypothetical protein